MPRTLQQLKEVSSKKSLENIHDDPALNSTLGNVKKLNNMLGELPADFATNTLRDHLGAILDGADGKLDEEKTNIVINNLNGPLHLMYLMKTGSGMDKLPDEKQRNELKNLIEYVAAGTGVGQENDYRITKEQRDNIARQEDREKIQARSEQAEADRIARQKAYEGKSALNVLDEHKAAVGKLPKRFTGKDAAQKEAEARKQLKSLCIDIMATRRAVEAKRNDKSGLSKASIDADHLLTQKEQLSKCDTLNKFLDTMSYKDLRSLAESGHGGAMEEKFAEHIKNMDVLPKDVPDQYMPTARQRVEALQAKMDNQTFAKTTPPAEQRKLYVELLATRAVVNSTRGVKSTLDRSFSAEALDAERQKFTSEPLHSALVRTTAIGDRQEFSYKAAMSGHGGALEDRLRQELRRMAIEKENGYQLQTVDARFSPTAQERYEDIAKLEGAPNLSKVDKLRLAMESGILKEQIQAGGGNDRIDIAKFNTHVSNLTAEYSKLMTSQSLETFIDNTKAYGHDRACAFFEEEYAGPLKAMRLEEKLNAQLETADMDQLPKIVAQKMFLYQHKAEYQEDKDSAKLENALEKKNLNMEVDVLTRNHLFKEVCDKLGPEGLTKYARENVSKLFDAMRLAKEDKLEPYKPEAPAAGKKGPANEKNVEQKAPQAGGPVA